MWLIFAGACPFPWAGHEREPVQRACKSRIFFKSFCLRKDCIRGPLTVVEPSPMMASASWLSSAPNHFPMLLNPLPSQSFSAAKSADAGSLHEVLEFDKKHQCLVALHRLDRNFDIADSIVIAPGGQGAHGSSHHLLELALRQGSQGPCNSREESRPRGSFAGKPPSFCQLSNLK